MRTCIASLLAVAAAFSSQPAHAQDYTHSLPFGGRNRTYEVHVPPKFVGKGPLPVIINLHGGSSNAKVHRVQTLMDRTSNQCGFIVVYPEGTSAQGTYYTWNAGSCCGYSVLKKIDDVGFIKAMLDELPNQYSIDKRRVYATGMSNGAMMAYRLACEIPDRITAICGVSATMGVSGPQPSRPVPVMQIHGLLDRNAPFEGGVGENALLKIPHRSVREVAAWWCNVNRCKTRPAGIIKQADYTMENYDPGTGRPGAPVILYMLHEGGHTWPGGIDVTPNSGTGKVVAFDTNMKMWEFFRQFSLR